MPDETERLGGRLPVLAPGSKSTQQRAIYDRLSSTMIPWADSAGFMGKADGGGVIGPFNPVLYSPGISVGFLDFREAEQKHTTLSARVRQVVILAVGSVWKSDYELYAHSAVGRKAGFSKAAVQALAEGGLPEDLSEQEKIAQRYARQLSAEHRVDGALYGAAERAFGKQGLVDITYLAGLYHVVCGLLNGFEIPAPGAVPSRRRVPPTPPHKPG